MIKISLLCFFGFTTLGLAQTGDSTVHESMDVVVREIQVHVLDKDGQFVPGLGPGDFMVTENGEKKDLSYFEEVDLTVPPGLNALAEIPVAGAQSMPYQPRRSLVILVDSANMAEDLFRQGIEAAREFITNDLFTGDLVKIVQMDEGFNDITPFLSDRQMMLDALGGIEYKGFLRTALMALDQKIGKAVGEYMEAVNESTSLPITLDEFLRAILVAQQTPRLPPEGMLINHLVKTKEQAKRGHYVNLEANLERLSELLHFMPAPRSVFYFSGGSFLEKGGSGDTVGKADEIATLLNGHGITAYSFLARRKIDSAESGLFSENYVQSLDVLGKWSLMPSETTDRTDWLRSSGNTVVENMNQLATGPNDLAVSTGGVFLEATALATNPFRELNRVAARFYRMGMVTNTRDKIAKIRVEPARKSAGWKLIYGRKQGPHKEFAQYSNAELTFSCEMALLHGLNRIGEYEIHVAGQIAGSEDGAILVPVQMAVPELPPAAKGYQVAFAAIDEQGTWLDRTLVNVPAEEHRSDVIFSDLLIMEKLPRRIRFFLRNLDDGRDGLATYEPPQAKPAITGMYMEDPVSKSIIPLNHLRSNTAEGDRDAMRKSMDFLLFDNFVLIPSDCPVYRPEQLATLLVRLESPPAGEMGSRFAIDGAGGHVGTQGIILKSRALADGSTAMLVKVRIPHADPGPVTLTVSLEDAAGNKTELTQKFQLAKATRKRDGKSADQLLLEAIVKGSPGQLSSLLESGADINSISRNGTTPLLYAAYRNDTIWVRALLERGAQVDSRNNQGVSSLMMGADWKNAAMCRHLLEHGADPNAVDLTGSTALFFAANRGATDLVDLLLEHGTNLNLVNNDGATAIFFAVQADRLEAVKHLTKARLDVYDKKGYSPLVYAIKSGSGKMVRQLLSMGADANGVGPSGFTPLMYAALFREGEIIPDLVAAGAKPNAVEVNGNTALTLVADQGFNRIVPILVGQGADVNAANVVGETPLSLACVNEHLSTVRELLEAGAAPNQDVGGVTPLMLAALKGNEKIVRLLLKQGADPNLLDSIKQTVLHYGEQGGNPVVMRVLKKAMGH